ncbi:MAG: ComF family protein [Gammaproteobacteria bacterium]|nr:ComF family protein [Gammaproteobacteria bacterium]
MRSASFTLFPGRCLLCGNPSRRALDLCAPCEADLPYLDSACGQCALPLPAPGICARCQQHPPPFAISVVPCRHAFPIDHLIQRLKYGGELAQVAPLASLLATALRRRPEPLPQALVPVPLHWRRQATRGFNQALELANQIGKTLAIPVRPDLVRRARATPPQVGMARTERRRNLARAFVARAASMPEHIALIDDVVTTGSTMEALARCLGQAGAARIEVWAISRALLAN